MGQGTPTSLAIIAAEEFGIPLERVKVNQLEMVNTDSNPYTWQTVGSRGLFSDGSALLKAIDDDLYLEYENLREFYDGILSLKPKDMRDEGISEMELKRKKAEIRKGKRLNFKTQVNRILLSLYKFR